MSAAQQMDLFQTLMYVSMAIAVVGLGLAVFFFFYFDIRSVHALMSGKAKRDTIERMAEQHSKTGHLRMDSGSLHSGGLTSGNLKPYTGSLIQNPSQVTTADIRPTDELPEQPEEREETVVLNEAEQTTVLNAAPLTEEDDVFAGETRILSAPARPEPEVKPACVPDPAFRFDITESTLVIHTNEIL